jgi:hypothetical protein
MAQRKAAHGSFALFSGFNIKKTRCAKLPRNIF